MPFTGLYAKDAFAPSFSNDAINQVKTTLFTGAEATNPAPKPGILNFSTFTAAIEFLSTDTETKFLGRPRILTLNNQPAEIRVVSDPVTGVERTIDNETGDETYTYERASDLQLVSEGVGVYLRILPQVNENNEITLFILPKVSDVTASGIADSAMDPEVRGTKSVVRLKDGETVVLSGLIRDDREEIITKLPFLGDIPFLGNLFRHKQDTKIERELIIFITPHIVKQEGATQQMAKIPQREQVYFSEKKEVLQKYLDKFEK